MSEINEQTTKEELQKMCRNEYPFPAYLIEHKGERGIAIVLGENLVAETWLNGDIIVFWENGDQTVLPDKFRIITRVL